MIVWELISLQLTVTSLKLAVVLVLVLELSCGCLISKSFITVFVILADLLILLVSLSLASHVQVLDLFLDKFSLEQETDTCSHKRNHQQEHQEREGARCINSLFAVLTKVILTAFAHAVFLSLYTLANTTILTSWHTFLGWDNRLGLDNDI